MKKVLIILAICAIIGVGLIIWFLLKGSTAGNNVANTNSASGTQATSTSFVAMPPKAPAGDTIAIGTGHGVITVKNFYKNAVGQEEEYVIFERSAGYDLLYSLQDSSFVVSIKSGTLSQVQPQAEQAFLSDLGISQSDACRLVVVVGVNPSVDPSLANQALPLSFCASSTFSG